MHYSPASIADYQGVIEQNIYFAYLSSAKNIEISTFAYYAIP
jgi:hypothetical protein